MAYDSKQRDTTACYSAQAPPPIRRAIAFKFALAPQCSALNKNDAAHPVEHLAIGPFDPPTAILRVTGTQCMMRYCRTTSWIWASQCHNYDIVMS